MLWLFFACLTVAGGVGYNVSVKIAGESINAFLFATILALSALVAHIVAFGIYKYFNTNEAIIYSKAGIWTAAIAGCCTLLINIGYFYALKYGSLTITSAVWLIGGLVFTTLISVLYFHEILDIQKIIGLIFGVVALVLLVR